MERIIKIPEYKDVVLKEFRSYMNEDTSLGVMVSALQSIELEAKEKHNRLSRERMWFRFNGLTSGYTVSELEKDCSGSVGYDARSVIYSLLDEAVNDNQVNIFIS
jgi:hypothetical protein